MNKYFSAIEQALSKRQGGAPEGMRAQSGRDAYLEAEDGARQTGGMERPAQADDFDAICEEIMQLSREGRIPQDFDLQAACADKAFAALLMELPTEAAVRVYEAEKRAEEAEQAAMQRMTTQVKSRNALPRSARGGAMSAPGINYRDMDSAAFRSMLADIKKTTRNGGKVRL